ncbi:AAA-like domain-containing protein [Dolichospermum heterosporum]|uniref:AAA-like domain-containing protein n=1 Tax=Dolichospermum heterosporum TAC447 TaxID=747523 RepID=A0ABY5LWP0_9CYAN|nr:AAA-like domain-containing protein [Dolichospermum heterosporum]UUO15291.1 AAA-like domain-containing protein [Dolichospermum heterosporum TAC447]
MSIKTSPGIHPMFSSSRFSQEIQGILKVLSNEFFLTNNGDRLFLGYSSEYEFIVVEPTSIYTDLFNLNKEIVVVFSPYTTLQARTLDVFDKISERFSALRLEKICGILVSKDPDIETSLPNLTKNEPESQIIIPFNYNELQGNLDTFFIRNRFRKYFYSRDLFAFQSPLRKDIYFFGRNDLIQTIINRYKSGENSGLFGLRKTGKTSVIYGIERSLGREDITSIFIDCQNTAFNQRRWFESLYYVCKATKDKLGLNVKLPQESDFTEKNASIHAETFFKRCRKQVNWPLFLIFDEIENISLVTSPALHWSQGIDFVLFWQTLRSIFQKGENLISYLIVGTNPSCIERPKIEKIDNPIFNHFTPLYIPGFDFKDTKEMVNRLGSGMGLNFDETVYAKLTEDFGGHPFLIRHVCSLLSKELASLDRPVRVDRLLYQNAKNKFIRNNSNYLDMILVVLTEFYPDEFEMLTFLANGDNTTFNEFAEHNHSFTEHLLGYGLIQKSTSGYDFKIDSIQEYLLQKSKYKKLTKTLSEKWQEISERRNLVEIKLRKIVRMQLKAVKGSDDAKQIILDIFGGKRKSELAGSDYNDLFNPNHSEIYFLDLAKIISKEWDVFKNIFSNSKRETFKGLDFINQSRVDAHAKDITDEEFAYFRICMSKIEKDLEEFL